MEFRLLGPLEARAGDGAPLPLGGTKQRALLALLVLNANHVVARDRLIDELWGEAPPESAVASVQIYVSRLRKVLPAGVLETRTRGYVLTVEPDAIDVLRFESLLAEAHGAEPERASRLLHDALALWRGQPLGEFGTEPFAPTAAARLEQLRLSAVEERIDADLALGRHAEVVGELGMLIAGEPHRERLRGQLMLALYRSGRQADALKAYRETQATLDELGLEPSPRLRQLERQILRQDAVLDLGRESLVPDGQIALPGPLVPTPSFPFVGRSAELAELQSLLVRAEDGVGRFVLLTGEAGGGKTRLVRELAQEAASRGVLVMYGTSDPAVSTPYQPLREWLEFLVRACRREAVRESLGNGAGILARLVPELGELTGASASQLEGDIDRYSLHSAVVDLLARASRRQPLLVVADDIHWADAETLHLLGRLAGSAPEARVLVVAIVREVGEPFSAELSDALANLSRLDSVTRIGLRNLSTEEMGDFIRVCANAEATGELAAVVGELTNGTPLLLCELWRELLQSGGVEVSEAGVRLARAVDQLHGTERIRDVVQQRLARLSPETRGALELAAVLGARFELRTFAAASGLAPDALIGVIDEGTRAGMIEELPEVAPAYRFVHELVRRAVYDRLTGMRRAELHLRAGEALEGNYADSLGRVLPELAHHFTVAVPVGGVERATDYNLRAGYAALATAAFEEGVTRMSAALELGIADARIRARVQVELGELLRDLGRVKEGSALIERVVEEATALGDEALAARARRNRRSPMGDPRIVPDEHLAKVEGAETFRLRGDLRGAAVAGRALGLAYRRGGRLAEACDALEAGFADAASSGDRAIQSQVAGTLAYALCDGPTPVREAIERCRQLLDATRGQRAHAAVITRCLSALFAMDGRFDEAREAVERSGPLLDGLNIVSVTWVYKMVAADAKELIGDLAGAQEELRLKWLQFRDLGDWDPDARGMAAAYMLALLYCDEGRWDEAERCLEYGSEVPEPPYFLHETVARLAAAARLAAHRGEFEQALTGAERAVELAGRSDFLNLRARVWLAAAEVRRIADRIADADAATAEALRLYEAKGNIAGATRIAAIAR